MRQKERHLMASTTCHEAAGKPLKAEGKSPVASTVCEIHVNMPVVGNEESREHVDTEG